MEITKEQFDKAILYAIGKDEKLLKIIKSIGKEKKCPLKK